MRVVLFFDGKNFYSGLKDQAPNHIIDFAKMSKWLVKQVGGLHLWGSYYYTGVESGPGQRNEGQIKLSGFLDMLELQPGFFVKRFPRKTNIVNCLKCGEENRFTLEKEIDTTMVADMLTLAAVGAFDTLVLLSGDTDLTPAVEGVRALGKQVYVATWGKTGLSLRLRRAAFDHIELLDGLSEFSKSVGNEPRYDTGEYEIDGEYENDSIGNGPDPESMSEDEIMDVIVEELSRAEQTFGTGYVGMNYFIKRWQSSRLIRDPEHRRILLERLVERDIIEIYEAADGNKALRVVKDGD